MGRSKNSKKHAHESAGRVKTRTHVPAHRRKKQHGDPSKVAKATWRDWIGGARVRTLSLAVAPVAIGTGAAALANSVNWLLAGLCLAVAVALQIGVNFANDYSDGVRGTDAYRVGPARLTGSGAAKPRSVLIVALVFFALAAGAGIAIVLLTSMWWLLAVGAVAIIAAWFYTGGKRPYGYIGLGEVVVFIFFGLVATVGTTFVQSGLVTQESLFGGIGIGLIACAVLVVNNLRDIDVDRAAGKRTLSVRAGEKFSRVWFCVLMLAPFVIAGYLAIFYGKAWFVQAALLAALPACLIVLTAKTAKEYVLALKITSFVALAYGLLLGWAFLPV